ncbi:MAG TPA: thioredoxin, partial [Myxococcales bacterium]|nr:thioredoxin [Myxococcales bacterium]
EFSDFQCPFCNRGAKTIDQIKKAYAGKVRVVFKHLPLPFHKQAHLAAQASMAAHAQGKFWPYHDKLFAN